MPRLAALALPDRQRPRVGVEIVNPQPCTFLVTRTGFERRPHQAPKVRITGTQQSLAFGDREIADACSVGAGKWLDATPGLIARDLLIVEREVERGLEDGEGPISTC